MPSAAARTVLVLPALNEEAAIGTTLDRVPKGLYQRILVADNGSTDRTSEVARAHGATVVFEPERGYGAACLRALREAGDAEIVVFMDADASDEPAEAELLVAPILEGRADFVIGSRVLGKADAGALQPHQRFGNWLATFLIRLIYGHRYTDLGPFRAIRASALKTLDMRDRNYGWTVEMQIKAIRHKLRIVETPVTYHCRIGVSKVSGSLKGSLLAGVKILWLVIRFSISR
jgi:glycosyltransferase involved in cell wall biosynthesis